MLLRSLHPAAVDLPIDDRPSRRGMGPKYSIYVDAAHTRSDRQHLGDMVDVAHNLSSNQSKWSQRTKLGRRPH